MKMTIRIALLAMAALAMNAATVLFSNGDLTGTNQGGSLGTKFLSNGNPNFISDSFSLGSDATVNGFDFLVSNNAFNSPGLNNLEWFINTNANGTGTLESGTVVGFQNGVTQVDITASCAPLGCVNAEYYLDSVSISSLDLTAGTTYYLEIGGAPYADPATKWVEAIGPLGGQSSSLSGLNPTNLINGGIANGNAFDLTGISTGGTGGDPTETPEPALIGVMGFSFAAMVFFWKVRKEGKESNK